VTSVESESDLCFNPLDPASYREPYARLAEIRRRCPVSEALPGHFFVATDGDARQVLLDFNTFSNAGNFQLDHPDGEVDPPTIVQLDPPRHNLFRRLVAAGLNPRAVRAAEPFVRETARQLVEKVQSDGRGDLMAFLAQPLPSEVIAHLIGVPAEHAPDFTRWTAEITSTVPRSFHHLQSWADFKAFIDRLIAERRADPSPPDDIVTRLLQAEEEGTRLDDGEIRMAIFQFIVAGNDTATRLIGNVVHELLRTRELWERVAADRSLIPTAIDESLRHDSPIQWVMRRCTTEAAIHGVKVEPGQRVLVGIGSANRDETVWADPDSFSLDRADVVDKHLAMGSGRHYCLGAPLGRLEARVALEALMDLLPSLALAEGFEIEFVESAMMRGPKRLDVVWEATRG